MEETSITIKCPICKTEKLISIPIDLVKKDYPMTPVKIGKSVCCEHDFIVFISKNMKQVGAEITDLSLNIEKELKRDTNISFTNFLDYYGMENVINFLKAVIFGIPIVFLVRNDFSMNLFKLNSFFRKFMPENHKKPFPVSTILKSELNTSNLKNVLFYDILDSELKFPWEDIKKSNKFIMQMLEQVMKIADDHNRVILIHENIKHLLIKAEYMDEFIKKSCKIDILDVGFTKIEHLQIKAEYMDEFIKEPCRIDILEAEFIKKFEKTWEKGEFELLQEICQNKYRFQIERLTRSSYS